MRANDIQDNHIQAVSQVRSHRRADLTSAHYRDEEVTPEEVKDQSYDLDVKWDVNLKLSRQELSCCIKQGLSPDSRDQNATIQACNLGNVSFLVYCDEDLISKNVYDYDWNHYKCADDFASVQKDSALLVLLSTKTLADE